MKNQKHDMMEPWMKKLTEGIERIVGKEKVSHYQVAVLPQILADFYKMLQSQSFGVAVHEQYRMEDGSMEIELCGVREADGSVKVTDARAYRG